MPKKTTKNAPDLEINDFYRVAEFERINIGGPVSLNEENRSINVTVATENPTLVIDWARMEVVNEVAGYDIRQKKSRATECLIPRYAFIKLAYDMYPNKQFVIDNLKILDRCTIYHILYNFDRLYNRYEGLRVFMGKVLEKL